MPQNVPDACTQKFPHFEKKRVVKLQWRKTSQTNEDKNEKIFGSEEEEKVQGNIP